MRQDSSHAERPVMLASGPVASVGAGQADASVTLPVLTPLRARLALPRIRIAVGPVAGRIALGTLMLAAFAVVLFATAQASTLVPQSQISFPRWESGPLHHLFGKLTGDYTALSLGFSGVLIIALIAYGVALAAARSLSMRTIAVCVVALHLILLMNPPIQLTDLFNYLGYARLGGLHHLNPYTHGINAEVHDPIFRFTTWHNLKSPYGPLFTALSYPLAFTSLPVAYWITKLATVLMSLGFIALVWWCARKLGRDPRYAVLLVAANPIYLFYAVAGFHNDFFMLVPSTAAIAFLLARRDRAAGAAVVVAVAVKFTAILLLPFLLIAARPTERRLRVLTGAVLATVPLVALSVALFGLSIPNLQDQSTLLTTFSLPNVVGDLIGAGGGTPALLRLANLALVVVVLWQLRRGRDWLAGAGWSTVALVASLAWLVPWYAIWALPLAALAGSVRLRRAALMLTAYLVLAFMPATGIFLSWQNINLMAGPAGIASGQLQHKLAH